MDTTKMGVFVKGLIMAKNEYFPKNNGDPRYTLDIGVPGNRHNLPVSVSREIYEKVIEFGEFACRVSVSTFNGSTFFSKAD